MEILAHMPDNNDPDRKRLVNTERLRTACAEKLSGPLGMARDRLHPHYGQSLADLEAEYLHPLIFSDEGIAKVAAQRASTSNVVELDQQKAATAA